MLDDRRAYWPGFFNFVVPPPAQADGGKDSVAFPQTGSATLEFRSGAGWRNSADARGTCRVTLSAVVDVTSAMALAAKPLDRAQPCGDVVSIQNATAKPTGATTLRCDIRSHCVKRV